jgi:hypothetical protein
MHVVVNFKRADATGITVLSTTDATHVTAFYSLVDSRLSVNFYGFVRVSRMEARSSRMEQNPRAELASRTWLCDAVRLE